MRLIDLPRTGSFRLALIFLALFGAASSVVFGFLYLQTDRYILGNIDSWLARETPEPFGMSVPDIVRRFDTRSANAHNLDRIFTLFDANGRHLGGDSFPLPDHVIAFDQPFNFRVSLSQGHTRYRGIAHRMPGGEIVLVAQNMYEAREFDEAFIATIVWGGLLTAALGLLGATIVGFGTAKRLDGVALAIQRIVGGDLSRRLPSHGTFGDLDRLTHVVNGMLDDIERLMQDVKGVCDGIAHDLRTPLTRILAGLERAQRRAISMEDYANAIDDANAEIRGVLKTFSALLRIAELEDGAKRSGFASVDLETIAGDVIEFYEPIAEEKDIKLKVACVGPPPFEVKGDASLLFDALANLIDNSIKFAPEHGTVTVEVEHSHDGVGVIVRDTGSGIALPEREAVLRRFYRSELCRQAPGNGLGLALVSAIARLHDFVLTIDDAAPGCRISLRQRRL